jgi:hypothetical protein
MLAQLGCGHEPGVKEHIRGYDSLCQWISACEVDDSTECGRGRQTTPEHNLFSAEKGPAD